jgi:hypothetical protein
MTRTRGLALVLVLLVGGAAGYWIWPWAGPTASLTSRTGASGGRGGAPTGGHDDVTDIRLELLQRERGALGAPDRNPFRFERRAAAAPPPRLQAARRPAPIEEAPAGPVPPPPPPPIPLRFIGYLQPSDTPGRVAVLSDGRGNVFNGKEGDVIEGRYRLLRVGDNSADLIYLDGRGRQTIRLSGQ